MVASRRRGLWTGGLVPLGYRAEEKRLVMVPEEAAQVREIFKLYLGIGSVLEVASVLNRRGWKARSWKDPAGRPYDKAAVRRILTNPVYLGKVEYDGDLHDGVHEAIIDRETWDAVQELLTGGGCGRRTRGTSGTTTILQGLVRCGACGATMGYHAARKGPRAYGYLVCQTLQTRGASACSGSRVPVPDLEAFVVERIRAIGKDPRLVAETLRAARQQVRARRPEVQAELRRYERERGKLDLERRNLVEAVAGGKAGSPSLLQRLGEVEVKVSDLDGQLDRLQHEIAALEQGDIDEADLRAALASFTPLWEALNREEQARVLHLLLERVTYHAGKAEVEITFRPCGVRILAERGETP